MGWIFSIQTLASASLSPDSLTLSGFDACPTYVVPAWETEGPGNIWRFQFLKIWGTVLKYIYMFVLKKAWVPGGSHNLRLMFFSVLLTHRS
jgi:hypothetical protein